MTATPTLRSGFAWTFIGQAAYAASLWLLAVALARLGSAEMLGQFSLGFAIASPILFCTNLQLRNAQATDSEGVYTFEDYSAVRSVSTLAGLAVILAVVLPLRLDTATKLVVLTVSLAKAIESESDVIYGAWMQDEKMRPMAVSLLLRAFSSVALALAALCVAKSALLASLGVLAGWAIVYLVHDRPRRPKPTTAKQCPGLSDVPGVAEPPRRALPRWASRLRLVRASLPLGLAGGILTAMPNIPRYVIQYGLGAHALGAYAAVTYLLQGGTLISSALGQTALPRLSRHRAEAEHMAFFRLVWRLLLFGFLTGIVIAVIAALGGGPILALLYGSEYARYGTLFAVLALAASFSHQLASRAVPSWHGVSSVAMRW